MIEIVINECVECHEYDKQFIEVKEGQHFKYTKKDYLCPPCFVNYTQVYYNRTILGKTNGLDGTVGQSDLEDWIGWEV